MRVLLTPVADRPESAKALKATFDLGHRLGASVRGCHIRPHRYSGVSLSSDFAEAAWRKKSTKKAPTAAKALFAELAAQNGYEVIRRARQEPGALWQEKVGSPDKIMGIEGPASDLVVVSRPPGQGGVADMFMRAALFHSARPVLLLPPAGRRNLGRNICVAWNQSPSVSHAVSASLPLLEAAESVTFITAGPEDAPGPKALQMVNYLKFHGIKADRVMTNGHDVESELFSVARDIGANLMIAGAYSHSRWREMIFGGTTRYLIYEARLPVLTMHS